MGKKTTIKLVFLVAVLAALLGGLLWKDNSKTKQIQDEQDEKQQQIRPLSAQKEDLEQELVELEKTHRIMTTGMGTSVILMTDLDERIYTEIYPRMKRDDVPGMLAISQKYFPDQEKRLTTDQIKELQAEGWGVCVTWGEGDSSKTVKELKQALEKKGIELTDTIYFETKVYKKKYDKELASAGYKSVIHHGEDDRPLVTSDVSEKMWFPGAVGIQGYQPRYRLNEAVAGKHNIIFTISYVNGDEAFHSGKLNSLIGYFQDYINKNSIALMLPDEAREYYKNRGVGLEEEQAQYEAKKQSLQSQISELDSQIKKIQDE